MPKSSRQNLSFPEWRGFERPPLGTLLEIVVDQTGDIGIAYERSCDFLKERHSHDRWQVTFARPGCRLSVKTFNSKARTFKLDPSNALILPVGLEHDATSVSAIYDTFTIYPSARAMSKIAGSSSFAIKTSDGLIIERSEWLNTLIDQYFHRRIVRRDGDHASLGREILRELVDIVSDKPRSVPREAPIETSPLAKALIAIESNLFSEMTMESLAVESAASVSTLARLFRANLKTTPMAYRRRRRLEEARAFLTSTDKSIGEIATLVGFTNQGAFTDAFKSAYRISPRALRNASQSE